MLGTTIICSALVTGDTMSRTVRGVGDRDARAAPTSSSRRAARDDATSPSSSPQSRFAAVDRALRATGLVDGIAPAIVAAGRGAGRRAAARPRRASRSSPPTPPHLAGFGAIRDLATRARAWRTRSISTATRPPKLDARAGDRCDVLAGVVRATVTRQGRRRLRRRRQRRSRGAAAARAGAGAARPRGPDPPRARLQPRRRDLRRGAHRPRRRATRAALAPLGLELQDVKHDGLELADAAGRRRSCRSSPPSAASRSSPASC